MPEPRSYDRTREAWQVDNVFWHLEWYFEALDIDEEKVQWTIASQVELIFNRLDDLEVDSRLTVLERKVNVFAEELDDLIEERVAHFTKWEVQWHKDLKGQRYFEVLNIDDEKKKVHMAVMYLTDTAASWWRHRYMDGCNVKTWEKFKRELQRQLYLDSVDDKPSTAEAEGRIREYVKEYSALMLKIPEMSERQRLCFFFDGLRYWVATELQRREPHDLASAMMIVERLGDFKQCERLRSPRHERAKGRGDGRSKSGSPKATDDERNEDEGRRRHHKGEKKHGWKSQAGWTGKKDFNIIDMYELGVVLGMDFMKKSSTALNPYYRVMMMIVGKEGQLEWMIPLVSKDGANARKGITVLQLDEGLTLRYFEWQMGPRTYAVDMLTKTITIEKFKHCLNLIHLLSC
ncbi:hypothetical protein RJ639_044464 [Escallonia herrerae]|uniref:Ty3 transposon capsid-like protein domain-containing protein n=1 Tax=Escallonia herrerae TaxID=1293975 RepID=A0AA88WDN6_9ASTE|nr:hypothetical protein RJ639_044464 [Escallonia herrerae]